MFRNLRGNKSTTSPCSVFTTFLSTVASDTAEDGGTHLEKLRIGHLIHFRMENNKPTRQSYHFFNDTDTFWSTVAYHARKRETNYIFSHGMAYDIRTLGWGEEVDKGLLSLSITRRRPVKGSETEFKTSTQHGLLVLNGPPVIVDSWFRGGERIRLVDTLNYWPVPFTDLCRYACCGHVPNPDPWDTDDDFRAYVECNNCNLMRAIVKLIQWHETQDLGVFKCTTAGIGMQAFKHRFNAKKIVLHDIPEVRQLERASYYAGRVATFYLGHVSKSGFGIDGYLFDKFTPSCPRPTGPIYSLDVNSLFPSVMKEFFYPRRLVRSSFTTPIEHRTTPALSREFIARVLIETEHDEYPVRVNGRTVYAVGRFITTLCGAELYRAVRTNHIREVYDWAEYELDDLFTGFVDHFWQQRASYLFSGDVLSAGLCKLIMNSLYGKWGQYSNEWVDDPQASCVEPWHRWYMIDGAARTISEYRSISNRVQTRCRSDTHPESFPAISAFIAGYARFVMDNIRIHAGYHNCLYQGVDSLHVNSVGFDRLKRDGFIDPPTLGKLRVEQENVDADYFGLNYYRIGTRRVIGGCRESAEQLDEYTYRQDHVEQLSGAVGHKPLGGYVVKRSVRRFMPREPATGVTANGWVYPVKINQCEPSLSNPATCCVSMRPAISTWLGSGHGNVSR